MTPIDLNIDTTKVYIPTGRQATAHKCPARYILYGGAMGGGKSVWLCMEGNMLSIEYPGNVGLICRWELSSLKRTTLETYWKFTPPELIKHHYRQDGIIELINGSKIIYMGLKPSSAMNTLERLKSLELGWFAIDEATEIQKPIFDLLKTRLRLRLPNGTFPRYRGLLASNPEPGWVRETFIDQDLPDHRFIPALPSDNPHLSPDYIEQLKQDLPPELVQKYIEGSWDVIEGDDYIFPYSWLRAAATREMEASEPLEAGIDIARFGGDKNSVAMRWGPVVEIVYRSSFQDTMRTSGEIANVLDEYQPVDAKIDSVGVGAGVFDRLYEQGYRVSEVKGGSAAYNPERFINIRAENHWGFRERLEAENVDLPDEPGVVSQMAGIKYKTQSDRRIQVESKQDMKKRGLKSPDDSDAIINAFGRSSQQGKTEIWIV